MTKSTPNANTYCVLSHISIAVQNDGDFCVCNLNTESLKSNKTKKVLKIHEDGLEEAWNSFTRKMIATGLDHGKRLPSCDYCWHLEDRGDRSPRQLYNETFKDVEVSKTQPKVLIIKPGNVCNLACRMCQPSTSTSLYQDFYKLDTTRKKFSGNFKEYTKNFEDIRNGFNPDNKLIWDVLDKWWSNLAFIDVYGGEPMLVPAFWNSVKFAVKQNAAKDISIQLHTNGTIWNEEYNELLTHFKQVRLNVSIDSHIKTHLEYIRHKSNSETVFDNLQRFVELAKSNTNITIAVTITISSYNIFYVDDTIEYFKNLGIPISINLVTKPELYDIRHLPQSVKNLLLTHVKNEVLLSALRQTIPGCDIEWPKFCQELSIIDDIRKQSFADTFPEWYEILKPHLTP